MTDGQPRDQSPATLPTWKETPARHQRANGVCELSRYSKIAVEYGRDGIGFFSSCLLCTDPAWLASSTQDAQRLATVRWIITELEAVLPVLRAMSEDAG